MEVNVLPREGVTIETTEEGSPDKVHIACMKTVAGCLCGHESSNSPLPADAKVNCVLCEFIWGQEPDESEEFPCRYCGTTCWWSQASPWEDL